MEALLATISRIITFFVSSFILLILVFVFFRFIKPIIDFYLLSGKVKEGKAVIEKPVVLQVFLPRGEEKDQPIFAEVLNTLHSLLWTKNKLGMSKKNFFSLEMVSLGPNIYFFIVVSEAYQKAAESQIYANYPNAEITVVDDYSKQISSSLVPACAEMKLKGQEILPLKTFESEDSPDPLGKIAGFLSRAGTNEQFWLQFSLYPESGKWWLRGWQSIFFNLRSRQEKKTKGAKGKLAQRLYRSKIRLVYWAKDKNTAETMLKGIIDIFKDTEGVNKLQKTKLLLPLKKNMFVNLYRSRIFEGKGFLLSPKEIATIYHLPSSETQAPNVPQTTSRKGAPPDKLPLEGQFSEEEVTIFGETSFRNENKKFGIKRADRQRHLYVIGKTGMGKSKLLEILLIEDLKHNKGLTLIDPHGESAETVIKYVPKSRIKDTIYFNPPDADFPIAFNILETTYDAQKKHIVTTGFISIFKKLFWAEWTPRMEQIARYTVMALLETPDSSILAVPKLLTDKDYRQKVINQIRDPIVKNFWTQEFMSWSDRFASEAIVPLLNKVGEFLSNPAIRNCVGQTQNALDFEKIINQNKIFIANLSKGQLSEENSALLGSMIITKMQEAALARAKVPEKERVDHYVYIDEFQNFATSAFNTILSEARKYRLNLTLAHQFTGQLEPEIMKSIFGNVSSVIAFRTGGEDSVILEKEFSPVFSAQDFLNLNFREMYLKLSIDTKTTQPFSGRTIDLESPKRDVSQEVIDFSRKNYGRPRHIIENEINQISGGAEVVKATSAKFEEPII